MLVINETRVIPARLYARKIPSGGKLELLLLRHEDEHTWEVLAGGKGLSPGQRFRVDAGPEGEVVEVLDGPRRRVRFDAPIENWLDQAGHVPLPPYIHTPLSDPERYQTVYSRQPGSVAAPTAGLHFTPGLLEKLAGQGIQNVRITLHVGLDTFAPVTEENPLEHRIHNEWCQVTPEVSRAINLAHEAGGRIVAVGTTSVRTLESAAIDTGSGSGRQDDHSPASVLRPYTGPTSLYILPGYPFRVVDAMITNFHLPRSTLIMLVSAFAGRERILQAYEAAKQAGYRFYSFGDAMLIL
jgi:S-adenosylmethionine:tRNA ribosyltransferase-isomerase